MMPQPRRLALVAGVLLLGGGAVLFWLSVPAPRPPARALPSPGAGGVPAVTAGAAGREPAASPLAAELHAARVDAAHDLEVLRGLLGQFTTTLRPAERPPLGDNADITAALAGRNRRRIVFIPSRHPALRGGLLHDREGTPYHFHPRSAEAIDVRSAGPDRVLFTADDLVSAVPGKTS